MVAGAMHLPCFIERALWTSDLDYVLKNSSIPQIQMLRLMLVADICFVDGSPTHPINSQPTQARFPHLIPLSRTAPKPTSYTNTPYYLLSSLHSPIQHIRAYSTYRNLLSAKQSSQSTTKPPALTHLTPTGAAHMVDISNKHPTTRLR